jgi:SAM-dependent methyltransferase
VSVGGVGWRRVDSCRGCGSPRSDWREVISLSPMPLAGQYCASVDAARAAAIYPLTWVQCASCALVQVLEDIDDALLYGEYSYSSSSVPGLVAHFERYAKVLKQRFSATTPLRVLELGCNDGVLLRRLPASWQKFGVDPSDVARRGAGEGAQYELISAPFTASLAREMKAQGLEFDLITASNCLAHISDLRDVFEGMAVLLSSRGRVVVEVHDLDALLRSNQWDTIYHEHKAEWSERSLTHCLARVGLKLAELDRLPLHGGLLRAWFELDTNGTERRVAQLEDFRDLRTAYEQRRSGGAYRELASAAASGRRIAAYGAAGRANVWLNQHPELAFEYIVDDSPLRVNRFLPAIATPVVPRERLVSAPPEYCLITAWNYSKDIQANNGHFSGRWLTAFEEA